MALVVTHDSDPYNTDFAVTLNSATLVLVIFLARHTSFREINASLAMFILSTNSLFTSPDRPGKISHKYKRYYYDLFKLQNHYLC